MAIAAFSDTGDEAGPMRAIGLVSLIATVVAVSSAVHGQRATDHCIAAHAADERAGPASR